MAERISTLQVRKRLGDILDRVALRSDEFVIERKGKPLAAVVPVEKLERLEDAARRYVLEILDRQRGSRLMQREADRLANEAKHRARGRLSRRGRR